MAVRLGQSGDLGGVFGTQPLERGVSASQSDNLGGIIRVLLLELDVLLIDTGALSRWTDTDDTISEEAQRSGWPRLG